ncbi:MAG: hypothetical protein V1781_03900 [Bacteroidota bacterium]
MKEHTQNVTFYESKRLSIFFKTKEKEIISLVRPIISSRQDAKPQRKAGFDPSSQSIISLVRHGGLDPPSQ